MLLYLDELIQALQKAREEFGNASVAIDDADTGWHMKIFKIRESNNVKGRILIEGAGYGNNAILKT